MARKRTDGEDLLELMTSTEKARWLSINDRMRDMEVELDRLRQVRRTMYHRVRDRVRYRKRRAA